ncbi:hypothetical protein BG011_004523 [Mortierella polycephala]|uniref:H/ACA ribonucleoprotein complex non-core subunit NAF1 n=1 Tax=Mortierella polycephala TaxID=41804 RepID=A0A9P6QGP4_9FUNG|nr:hypothetical protein BG011_004523 [Mortierella polycephala]
MDSEAHRSENTKHEDEDTLMEAGYIVAHHDAMDISQDHAQSNPPSNENGMDVDSHMSAATEVPSIQGASVIHGLTSAIELIVPAAENTSVQNDSSALASNLNNAEDRLDAALAGDDTKVDGYESSDLESSDDDDDGPQSSDSDSDSDTEMGAVPRSALTIEQRERALIEIDAMDNDEDSSPSIILHTPNEIVELPEVKRPDITLKPDAKLEPIGTVMSIVDSVVVVQAASSGEVRVFDAGTVTAIIKTHDADNDTNKEVLGEIFETFGPVARPLYSIRFNTASEIPAACTVGSTVYSVPEHSSFVLTAPLKALKGSDASNKFDEEVDEVEMEFSDDEKEMEHKRKIKAAKKKKGRTMASDTSAALQAIMGNTPASAQAASSSTPPRQPIALPPKPEFNEGVDGYRILQRPGVAARPPAAAGAGTVPWYQQQQRELQDMMGKQQRQPGRQQNQQQQFEKQQQLQQQLLLQQQQQQQLFQQQQEQQVLFQKQIQEAQATIQRLQQQQQQVAQQTSTATIAAAPSQTFDFRAHQQLHTPQQTNTSYSPQQAQYQPTASSFQPQQSAQDNQGQQQEQQQQQQIMNLLSPLFPQQQNPHGQGQQ